MHYPWRSIGTIFVFMAGIALAGCGDSGPRLTRVTGTVTYKGSPVRDGNISFVPEDGAEGAGGTLDAQGRYTLSTVKTGDGIRAGTYKVRVAAYQSPPLMNDPNSGKPAVPRKYFDAQTSDLTATVREGADQVLDFELKD
jgi:hypothetical protein